jgi:hypothetical protein
MSGFGKISLRLGILDTEHNFIVIALLLVSTFTYLEIGVVYLFQSLFSTSQSMLTFLNGIRDQAEQKLKQGALLKYSAWSKKSEIADGFNWTDISISYLEFHKVFEKYEKYVANLLIILYAFMTVGVVTSVYYIVRSDNPLVQQFLYMQTIMVSTAIFRIYVLASSGEAIVRKYEELEQTLVKINQAGYLRPEEKFEVSKM